MKEKDTSLTFVAQHMEEWSLELQTIDDHLEHSAHEILKNCEKLTTFEQQKDILDVVNSIVEYCNFHDLNSQRLRRMIKTMQLYLNQDQQNQGKITFPLHGPQRPRDALTQGAVESILNHKIT